MPDHRNVEKVNIKIETNADGNETATVKVASGSDNFVTVTSSKGDQMGSRVSPGDSMSFEVKGQVTEVKID